MFRTLQALLAGAVLVALGLARLAPRYPHIAWLQHFRDLQPRLTETQRARMQQRATILAGMQMILAGVVVPLLYLGSTIFMFNEPTARGMVISLSLSLLLIGLGITAIVRSRRNG